MAALAFLAVRRDRGIKEEYQKAIASSANPNPQLYFRLGEAYKADHKPNESIDAFTRAAELGRGTPLETYPNQQLKLLR